MKDVRITAVRKVLHQDLVAKYENPIGNRLFHRFYAAHGAAPTRIGVVLQCDIVVGAIATESPTVWVVINICI